MGGNDGLTQSNTAFFEFYRNWKGILIEPSLKGYEFEVLKGLNLNKCRPTYLLIEIYNVSFDDIHNHLTENNYKLICNFSNYNKEDNPGWDGTHNDYLFMSL